MLHGPDYRAQAMTVARYLEPVPYVVEDERVDGVVAVLGSDYGGVLFVFQEPMAQVRAQVQARGLPPVLPDPGSGFAPVAAGEGDALAPVAPAGGASLSLAPAAASNAVAALAAQSSDADPAPPTIQGRPPEGESCS